MKAKGVSTRQVSFDDVKKGTPGGSAEDPEPVAEDEAETSSSGRKPAGTGDGSDGAAAAQRRMDRAVQRGLDVPERTSSSRRDKARREWDEAAEACRRTPGCVPQYRDDARFGEAKPLKTDEELIEDVRKRGFSEPHPPPK
jgi:hypothetical protein